jgi:Tol biopolymer transport system component
MGRATGSVVGLLCLVAALAVAAPAAAVVPSTERVSVSTSGAQADGVVADFQAVTAHGRYVAWESNADNLVAGDTNRDFDLLLRDRVAGTTELVNVSSTGEQGNGGGFTPAISANARFVAFASISTNLTGNDTNNTTDIFLRDRRHGTTKRVSVKNGGGQITRGGFDPSITSDGRYIGFTSTGSNIVSGDTNGAQDVFLRDRVGRTTVRVDLKPDGQQIPGGAALGYVSSNGRYVLFTSWAVVTPGDTNGKQDLFLRDLVANTTELISVARTGGPADEYTSITEAISGDGRYVAFTSYASNLVVGDTNGAPDVFVRDRQTGTTKRVSLSNDGAQVSAGDGGRDGISADGRYVVFATDDGTVVAGDTNDAIDVFVRDLTAETTTRVSVDSAGGQANDRSYSSTISADGAHVLFVSYATDLVSGDTNGMNDVFIRNLR